MKTNTDHPGQGLLPNFCDVTTVFMLVLLVELLAVVLTLGSGQQTGFWNRLAMISLFTQWIALVNGGLLCTLRNWLNGKPVAINAAISFCIMMLVSLMFTLAIVLYQNNLGYHGYGGQTEFFLLRSLSISAVIYAVVLRYFYIQHQWVLNMQAQSHAQVQALKARIRPHFLFNSMNTIASLVRIDAERAEKAVHDLSDLFRASLKEQTLHTLEDEIALTRSYLDIESLRLGERLHTEWQLGDLPMDMEIPALCLQPLAENAVYYGVEPLGEGGGIKITAQIDDNRLCLSITNPVSSQNRMKNHKSNHMAQDNIRKRLALMYGDEADFDIQADASSYTVTLKIPIHIKS